MSRLVASVGPLRDRSSAAILVGQAAFDDPMLLQARRWADAIQSAAGGAPGVQVGALLPDAAAVRGVIERVASESAGSQLDLGVLDGALGGLRGHTLVLLGRGVAAPRSPGLVFFGVAAGGSDADTALDEARLGKLALDGDDVTASDARDGDWAELIGAIRGSIYQRVVVVPCGTAQPLDGFAARLRGLLGRPVYFNSAPAWFDGPEVTTPSIRVGPGRTRPSHAASGTRWFNTAGVQLQAGANAFLPGTEKRAT